MNGQDFGDIRFVLRFHGFESVHENRIRDAEKIVVRIDNRREEKRRDETHASTIIIITSRSELERAVSLPRYYPHDDLIFFPFQVIPKRESSSRENMQLLDAVVI